MDDLLVRASRELSIPQHQVVAATELLDGGNTIPFIARYRKEATGGLDEVQIQEIQDRVEYLRNLEKRREDVLRLIEEQGPFVIHADRQIAKPLDELLRAFVAQGRMKLVGEYRPSYRIA